MVTLNGEEFEVLDPINEYNGHNTYVLLRNAKTNERVCINRNELIGLIHPQVSIKVNLVSGNRFLDETIVFNHPEVLDECTGKAMRNRIAYFINKPDDNIVWLENNRMDMRKVIYFNPIYLEADGYLKYLADYREKYTSFNMNVVQSCDQVIRLLGFKTKLGWDIGDLRNFLVTLRDLKIRSLRKQVEFASWAKNFVYAIHHGLSYVHIEQDKQEGKLLFAGINFYDEYRYKRVNEFDMVIDVLNETVKFDRRIEFELEQCTNYKEFLI